MIINYLCFIMIRRIALSARQDLSRQAQDRFYIVLPSCNDAITKMRGRKIFIISNERDPTLSRDYEYLYENI